MGLGQSSMRKNYYRELMEKQKDLEAKNEALLSEIEKRKSVEQELLALNEKLEHKVQIRTEALTHSNELLKTYIDELEEAQNQLIEQEKLASLGTLVRGISHEINTPLGIGVTTASYLKDTILELQERVSSGTMTKVDFENELKALVDASNILISSVKKSVNLVNSFKNIAADKNSEKLSEIKVYDYITLILGGILNESDLDFDLETKIECDADLVIKMYPSILSQLLTIFVSNSIQHGYHKGDLGHINIGFRVDSNGIYASYSDDGSGIEPDLLKHVFDPFFTTSRNGRTAGLGLFVAYNLITRMNGTISLINQEEGGILIDIQIPLEHNLKADA